MKWATRKQIRVNRTATAWLIQRFIDPAAEFLFVEPQEVAKIERQEKAIGFDAPGTKYSHATGVTSFEQLLVHYKLQDPILKEMTRIVHGADIAGQEKITPESAGLRTISHGFPLVTHNDHETLEKAFFVYDALYASLKERLNSAREH